MVGTDRISIAQVEARVAAVRDGAAASGAATEEQPGLARHAVSDLILGKLIAQALADRQLGVSQAEVDRARTADAKTLGGEAKLTELLRAKQGVPAGDVDGFYRQQIGLVKLVEAARTRTATRATPRSARRWWTRAPRCTSRSTRATAAGTPPGSASPTAPRTGCRRPSGRSDANPDRPQAPRACPGRFLRRTSDRFCVSARIPTRSR